MRRIFVAWNKNTVSLIFRVQCQCQTVAGTPEYNLNLLKSSENSDLCSSCCSVLRRLQLPPSWCGSRGSSSQPGKLAGSWGWWSGNSWRSRASACASEARKLWGGLWKYGYSLETDPVKKKNSNNGEARFNSHFIWFVWKHHPDRRKIKRRKSQLILRVCKSLCLHPVSLLNVWTAVHHPTDCLSTCAGWEMETDVGWGKQTLIEMLLCNVMSGVFYAARLNIALGRRS